MVSNSLESNVFSLKFIWHTIGCMSYPWMWDVMLELSKYSFHDSQLFSFIVGEKYILSDLCV